MALSYGLNFTATDATNAIRRNDVLQNGVRTWRQLFGNAALGRGAQRDVLGTEFSSAIAEAYASNLAQRENIFRAGLSSADTTNLLSSAQQNMHDAYSAYVSKYRESLANVDDTYGSEVDEITAALEDRGQKLADLYSSAYEYWNSELAAATRTEAPTEPIAEGTPPVMTLIQLADEYDLRDLIDKDSGQPLSWEQASHLLLKPDGTLTERGRRFLDQMYNLDPVGYTRTDERGNEYAVRGFDRWLSDTNSELRDWMVQQDPYNYTRDGTNLGTAKALAGLESTDTTYGAYDYKDWSKLGEYSKDFSSSGLGKDVVDAYKFAEKKFADVDPTKTDHVPLSGVSITPEDKAKLRQSEYNRANEKLANYIKGAAEQRDALVSYAKTTLGTKEYDTFNAANKNLLNEYDAIYRDAVALSQTYKGTGKNAEYVGERTSAEIESLVSRYDAWQKAYYDELKRYSQRIKPKASGY